MIRKLFDVFFDDSFVGYCWDYTEESAISHIAGQDAHCGGWKAIER